MGKSRYLIGDVVCFLVHSPLLLDVVVVEIEGKSWTISKAFFEMIARPAP